MLDSDHSENYDYDLLRSDAVYFGIKVTTTLRVHNAYTLNYEDGGNLVFRNVSIYLPIYTASLHTMH
jgi:hypothetical protein